MAGLHGVNLDGWLTGATPQGGRSFIGEGDLALIASWRFTHVRVPVDDALLDGDEGWTLLDGAVEACGRYGLGCVLALRVEQAGLFREEARWRRLVRQWEALAARYAAWPGVVVYDLLDRPAPPDDLPEELVRGLGAARLSFAAARRVPAPGVTAGRAWSGLASTLTQAIRAVDEQHTIVVQAVHGEPEGFAHLRPTRDGNIVYAFECFEPRAFTGIDAPHPPAPSPSLGEGEAARGDSRRLTYPGIIGGERWDRERMERYLAPALEFGRTYEVPLYLCAFGVSAAAPRASLLTWVRSLLGLCRAHGIGWAYWTYRAFGDRPFGLVCDAAPFAALPAFQNPQRLDYELLGVLQSEA